MTHGHELYGGNVGGRGCAGWSGVKGEKWDNCNSIINKIYLKKNSIKENPEKMGKSFQQQYQRCGRQIQTWKR